MAAEEKMDREQKDGGRGGVLEEGRMRYVSEREKEGVEALI